MKWIVVYFFIQMVAIPCPSVTSVADEFGRVYTVDAVTLEACWDTISTRLEKEFNTKKEAQAFIAKAEKEDDLNCCLLLSQEVK